MKKKHSRSKILRGYGMLYNIAKDFKETFSRVYTACLLLVAVGGSEASGGGMGARSDRFSKNK
jgi:hypothetical protein